MPFSSNIKLSKTNKKPSKKPTSLHIKKDTTTRIWEQAFCSIFFKDNFPIKAIIHPIMKAT